MKNVTGILIAASLLTAVSCGNKNKSSRSQNKQEQKQEQPQPKPDQLITADGHYLATFAPLNGTEVSGYARAIVKGDSLTVKVSVNGSAAQTVHAQSIHLASECPTLSSDTNKDGWIDAVEGMASFGKVAFPLDYNLASVAEADAKFPTSDFTGNYFYNATASFGAMLKDAKIENGMNLEGRQVVIYGVAADTDLPDSVATINGSSKHSSLPIACGTLTKTTTDDEGTNTTGGKDE